MDEKSASNGSGKLVFSQLPSIYPFVHEFFDIEICAVDKFNNILEQSIEFKLDLSYCPPSGLLDEENYCNEYLDMKYNSSTSSSQPLPSSSTPRKIQTLANGKCKLTIRINKLSSEVHRHKFVLVATPALPLMKGQSKPLYCVRHRLIISNEATIPTLWYKDLRYSRAHFIPIFAELRSPMGLVLGRVVPVHLQVRYHSVKDEVEIVQNQKILTIYFPPQMYITKSGTCDIQCNFTQVSVRHNRRNFTLFLQPDVTLDPTCADISPVEFGNIEVRSKPSVIRKNLRPQSPIPNPTCKVPIESDSKSTKSENDSTPVEENSSTAKKKREKKRKCQTNADKMEDELSIPTSLEAETKITVGRSSPQLDPSQQSPKLRSPLADIPPDHSFFSDFFDTSHRTNPEIVDWIHDVMKAIKGLKWREIGREAVPCRSMDEQLIYLSRPLYDMPHPNHVIDHIIESYKKFFPESAMSSESHHSHGSSNSNRLLFDSLTSLEDVTNPSFQENETSSYPNSQSFHQITPSSSSSSSSFKYCDPFLPQTLSSSSHQSHQSPPRFFPSHTSSESTRPRNRNRSDSITSIKSLFSITETTQGEENKEF